MTILNRKFFLFLLLFFNQYNFIFSYNLLPQQLEDNDDYFLQVFNIKNFQEFNNIKKQKSNKKIIINNSNKYNVYTKFIISPEILYDCNVNLKDLPLSNLRKNMDAFELSKFFNNINSSLKTSIHFNNVSLKLNNYSKNYNQTKTSIGFIIHLPKINPTKNLKNEIILLKDININKYNVANYRMAFSNITTFTFSKPFLNLLNYYSIWFNFFKITDYTAFSIKILFSFLNNLFIFINIGYKNNKENLCFLNIGFFFLNYIKIELSFLLPLTILQEIIDGNLKNLKKINLQFNSNFVILNPSPHFINRCFLNQDIDMISDLIFLSIDDPRKQIKNFLFSKDYQKLSSTNQEQIINLLNSKIFVDPYNIPLFSLKKIIPFDTEDQKPLEHFIKTLLTIDEIKCQNLKKELEDIISLFNLKREEMIQSISAINNKNTTNFFTFRQDIISFNNGINDIKKQIEIRKKYIQNNYQNLPILNSYFEGLEEIFFYSLVNTSEFIQFKNRYSDFLKKKQTEKKFLELDESKSYKIIKILGENFNDQVNNILNKNHHIFKETYNNSILESYDKTLKTTWQSLNVKKIENIELQKYKTEINKKTKKLDFINDIYQVNALSSKIVPQHQIIAPENQEINMDLFDEIEKDNYTHQLELNELINSRKRHIFNPLYDADKNTDNLITLKNELHKNFQLDLPLILGELFQKHIDNPDIIINNNILNIFYKFLQKTFPSIFLNNNFFDKEQLSQIFNYIQSKHDEYEKASYEDITNIISSIPYKEKENLTNIQLPPMDNELNEDKILIFNLFNIYNNFKNEIITNINAKFFHDEDKTTFIFKHISNTINLIKILYKITELKNDEFYYNIFKKKFDQLKTNTNNPKTPQQIVDEINFNKKLDYFYKYIFSKYIFQKDSLDTNEKKLQNIKQKIDEELNTEYDNLMVHLEDLQQQLDNLQLQNSQLNLDSLKDSTYTDFFKNANTLYDIKIEDLQKMVIKKIDELSDNDKLHRNDFWNAFLSLGNFSPKESQYIKKKWLNFDIQIELEIEDVNKFYKIEIENENCTRLMTEITTCNFADQLAYNTLALNSTAINLILHKELNPPISNTIIYNLNNLNDQLKQIDFYQQCIQSQTNINNEISTIHTKITSNNDKLIYLNQLQTQLTNYYNDNWQAILNEINNSNDIAKKQLNNDILYDFYLYCKNQSINPINQINLIKEYLKSKTFNYLCDLFTNIKTTNKNSLKQEKEILNIFDKMNQLNSNDKKKNLEQLINETTVETIKQEENLKVLKNKLSIYDKIIENINLTQKTFINTIKKSNAIIIQNYFEREGLHKQYQNLCKNIIIDIDQCKKQNEGSELLNMLITLGNKYLPNQSSSLNNSINLQSLYDKSITNKPTELLKFLSKIFDINQKHPLKNILHPQLKEEDQDICKLKIENTNMTNKIYINGIFNKNILIFFQRQINIFDFINQYKDINFFIKEENLTKMNIPDNLFWNNQLTLFNGNFVINSLDNNQSKNIPIKLYQIINDSSDKITNILEFHIDDIILPIYKFEKLFYTSPDSINYNYNSLVSPIIPFNYYDKLNKEKYYIRKIYKSESISFVHYFANIHIDNLIIYKNNFFYHLENLINKNNICFYLGDQKIENQEMKNFIVTLKTNITKNMHNNQIIYLYFFNFLYHFSIKGLNIYTGNLKSIEEYNQKNTEFYYPIFLQSTLISSDMKYIKYSDTVDSIYIFINDAKLLNDHLKRTKGAIPKLIKSLIMTKDDYLLQFLNFIEEYGVIEKYDAIHTFLKNIVINESKENFKLPDFIARLKVLQYKFQFSHKLSNNHYNFDQFNEMINSLENLLPQDKKEENISKIFIKSLEYSQNYNKFNKLYQLLQLNNEQVNIIEIIEKIYVQWNITKEMNDFLNLENADYKNQQFITDEEEIDGLLNTINYELKNNLINTNNILTLIKKINIFYQNHLGNNEKKIYMLLEDNFVNDCSCFHNSLDQKILKYETNFIKTQYNFLFSDISTSNDLKTILLEKENNKNIFLQIQELDKNLSLVFEYLYPDNEYKDWKSYYYKNESVSFNNFLNEIESKIYNISLTSDKKDLLEIIQKNIENIKKITVNKNNNKFLKNIHKFLKKETILNKNFFISFLENYLLNNLLSLNSYLLYYEIPIETIETINVYSEQEQNDIKNIFIKIDEFLNIFVAKYKPKYRHDVQWQYYYYYLNLQYNFDNFCDFLHPSTWRLGFPEQDPPFIDDDLNTLNLFQKELSKLPKYIINSFSNILNQSKASNSEELQELLNKYLFPNDTTQRQKILEEHKEIIELLIEVDNLLTEKLTNDELNQSFNWKNIYINVEKKEQTKAAFINFCKIRMEHHKFELIKEQIKNLPEYIYRNLFKILQDKQWKSKTFNRNFKQVLLQQNLFIENTTQKTKNNNEIIIYDEALYNYNQQLIGHDILKTIHFLQFPSLLNGIEAINESDFINLHNSFLNKQNMIVKKVINLGGSFDKIQLQYPLAKDTNLKSLKLANMNQTFITDTSTSQINWHSLLNIKFKNLDHHYKLSLINNSFQKNTGDRNKNIFNTNIFEELYGKYNIEAKSSNYFVENCLEIIKNQSTINYNSLLNDFLNINNKFFSLMYGLSKNTIDPKIKKILIQLSKSGNNLLWYVLSCGQILFFEYYKQPIFEYFISNMLTPYMLIWGEDTLKLTILMDNMSKYFVNQIELLNEKTYESQMTFKMIGKFLEFNNLNDCINFFKNIEKKLEKRLNRFLNGLTKEDEIEVLEMINTFQQKNNN